MPDERTDEEIYQLTDDELIVHIAEAFDIQRAELQANNGADWKIAIAGRITNLCRSGLAGILKSRAAEFDQAFRDEDYRRVGQLTREVAGPEHTGPATKLLMAMTKRGTP